MTSNSSVFARGKYHQVTILFNCDVWKYPFLGQAFIIGFALMAAALFCLIPATEMWALYLFAAVFGFAAAGCAVSESPLVAELFGLRSHGLILGVINIGFCTGAAAGPFLAGYIFDVTSSYNMAFLVCAAVSAVGLILSAILTPTQQPHDIIV